MQCNATSEEISKAGETDLTGSPMLHAAGMGANAQLGLPLVKARGRL
jgi:hypothetical protein